jgi:hypothetical protein
MTAKQQLKNKLAAEKLKFELLVCEQIRSSTLSYKQIGTRFGVKAREVAEIASKHGANRKRGKGSVAFKKGQPPKPIAVFASDCVIFQAARY